MDKKNKGAKNSSILAVGRRKEAVARASLTPGKGDFRVNGSSVDDYFPTLHLRRVFYQAQELVKAKDKVDIQIRVKGGGKSGQAEACRLAISRSLQLHHPEHRTALKKAGFLTRDARVVERKKYGLHKARKGTQFSKR